MKEFIANNEEETMDFAERLGELLQPNQVITLDGDLGAGKQRLQRG